MCPLPLTSPSELFSTPPCLQAPFPLCLSSLTYIFSAVPSSAPSSSPSPIHIPAAHTLQVAPPLYSFQQSPPLPTTFSSSLSYIFQQSPPMYLPAAPPLYTFQQSLPYIPFSSPLPYLHLSAAPFPTSFSSPLQCTFQQPLPYTYFSSPSTMHLSAVPSPTYTFQQLPSLHHSAVLPHLSAVPSPMPSSSIPCYCSVPTCITNH